MGKLFYFFLILIFFQTVLATDDSMTFVYSDSGDQEQFRKNLEKYRKRGEEDKGKELSPNMLLMRHRWLMLVWICTFLKGIYFPLLSD